MIFLVPRVLMMMTGCLSRTGRMGRRGERREGRRILVKGRMAKRQCRGAKRQREGRRRRKMKRVKVMKMFRSTLDPLKHQHLFIRADCHQLPVC